MTLENIVYEYGNKNNVQVGICTAEGFEEIREILEYKNSRLRGFVEQDIEKRIYPSKTMGDVKSIIVFAIGYGKNFVFIHDGKLRGKISEGAIGLDYHIILQNKFQELVNEIKKVTDFNYKIFVDTGPLVDREVAKRAGIGILGKNGSIHSKKYGSMIFLGYMMTNLNLESSKIEDYEDCGECTMCIKACPGGALSENGEFKAEKCISYLTQTKNILSINEMKLIGTQIYGCDICQKVCPKNKYVYKSDINNIDDAMPDIKSLLEMTNRQFKDFFGKTAAGWRGKKIIQRNALVALGNIKNNESIEILSKYLNDERELIRETAKKAIEINKGE